MRNIVARQALVLASIAAALLATACGSEEGSGEQRGGDAPATPFVIDRVPAGFVAVAAGSGEWEQEWDTDWGSHEPFVLLGNGDRRVKISASGDRDGGDPPSSEPEGTQPGSGPWNVVGRTDDDGIRLQASSTDVDGAELDQLLDAASPEERRSAPNVGDLPEGWRVIGGSDADVLLAIGQAPGPTGAFGVSWRRGDGTAHDAPQLTAVSLPGRAADPEAWTGDLYRPIPWFGDAHGEALSVAGRPAAFVLVDGSEGGPQHVLLTQRDDGSLFVLTSAGSELLSKEQLVEIAMSVRPATDREWEELGWSTWGGPDLHPDDGAVELARGEADGTEWLLQATTAATTHGGRDLGAPSSEWHVRTCLKLKDNDVACTSGDAGEVTWSNDTGAGFPTFYVVGTSLPGDAVRVTTPSGASSGDLHDLPDGSMRVAVVFADPPETWPICSNLEGLTGIDEAALEGSVTVDVVDVDGEFVGCPVSPF